MSHLLKMSIARVLHTVNMLRVSVMLIVILFEPVSAQDCNFGPLVVVNETDSLGTVLFKSSKSAEENVTFSIVRINGQPNNITFLDELNASLDLWQNDTLVVISLLQPLDLEKFHEQYDADITGVVLEITCNGVAQKVQIGVQPVNEFAPTFVDAPYSITIPESTDIGDVVFEFMSRVVDRDFGSTNNLYIILRNYSGDVSDGLSFFAVPVVTNGRLQLTKLLDYDAPDTHRRFTLNVSVRDYGGLEGNTVLVIDILDVDDQNPYFKYPGCSTPCLVPQFDAITELLYTGTLQVRPITLQGQDDDTLNTPLLYSISAGNEHNLFTMNTHTAEVIQIVSVGSLQVLDPSFRLIIEVRKNLSTDLSSKAILVVHVLERKQNDTDYPPPSEEATTKNNTDLLIVVIILSVLSAIFLIALVVLLVMYRKNQNHKTMATVLGKNKSRKFINGGANVINPIRDDVVNDETSGKQYTDETKRKRKKKKTLIKTKKADPTESINGAKTTNKDQHGYLEATHTLPTTPSFNQSRSLPEIGSGVTNGTINNTVGNKDKLYPSVTDAYSSEPPTWQTFRDASVASNSK